MPPWSMSSLVVGVACLCAGVLAFWPSLRRSSAWAATATPLASIMGSGFLVSAPLLVASSGRWAPVAMAALLALAYGVGSLVRFNIRYAEILVGERPEPMRGGEHSAREGHARAAERHWAAEDKSLATHLEQISHLVLAGAYVVSVTYYLSLLSAFAFEAVGSRDVVGEKLLTSSLLAVITGVGAWRGLRALEGVERYAVAVNLGMIAALLAGLVLYNLHAIRTGSWRLPTLELTQGPLEATRHLMGLLIVVQGFETSRFLGGAHGPEERVRTMRWAQWVSAAIYLSFCSLALVLFPSGKPPEASVTAIIQLVAPVALVLPPLIMLAAAGSQFSAAVADDAGCSGLLGVFFAGRLSRRAPYLLIGVAALALTWATDVLVILSVASRAFAVFYCLQSTVAVVTAATRREADGRVRILVLGVLLAVATAAVAVFGIPASA